VIEVERGLPGEADLRQALRVCGVAAVIIRPAVDNPLRLKSVVETAQAAGAAVLIANDVAMARAIRADGAHLDIGAEEDESDAVERYEAARRALGKSASIGVGAGRSRHAAMLLGERGAEYVAFGPAPQEELADLIDWWAEMFVVPCVACIEAIECAAPLAATGADFIALTAGVRSDLAAELGQLGQALSSVEV
jgi:thiamine-phosphate pyrophosphorylase